MNFFIAGFCSALLVPIVAWSPATTFTITAFWVLVLCVPLNIIYGLKCLRKSDGDLPEALALVDRRALTDLRTHRQHWRAALVVTRGQADDRPFWQHEIDVFDKTILILTGEGAKPHKPR